MSAFTSPLTSPCPRCGLREDALIHHATANGHDYAGHASKVCGDLLSPGETFEHWCVREPGHAGDHRCGDCHDVWNPADPRDLEEFGPELHEKWDGTCPECLAMQG